MIFLLFFNGFPDLHRWLTSMHPDMPVLMFGALAAIEIGKIVEAEKIDDKWYRYIILIVLLFCCGIFKQNAVVLFFGFGIAILFSKSVDKKKKIKLLGSILAAGILVLLVIFGIDGCFEVTVQVMSRHGSVTPDTYKIFLTTSLKNNRVYVVLLLAFYILLITRNIKLTFTQKLWLVAALMWTAFNLYGGKKQGSDTGNIDVALIAQAPFVGITVSELLYKVKRHIQFDSGAVKEWKRPVFLEGCVYLFLAALMILWARSTYTTIINDKVQYDARKVDQDTVSEWLNENYPGGSIAVHSHYYYWLNKADVDISTDFYYVNAFAMADMLTMDDIKNAYDKYNWDLIIFKTYDFPAPPSEWDFANYKKIDGVPITDIIPLDVYVKEE